MTINLDKFQIDRIKEELRMMYDNKSYCAEEIGSGCINSTETALRIIKIDASIESARTILRFLGINAYYEEGKVILWDNANDCEVV